MKTKLNKYKTIIVVSAMTLVIVIIAVRSFVLPDFEISETSPSANQDNVSTNANIQFTFKKKLPNETQKNISVSFSPEIEEEVAWNNKTIRVTPRYGLQSGTEYKAEVQLKGETLYVLTFKTAGVPIEEIRQIAKEQTLDDYEFGETWKQIIEESPWFPYMPIEASSYTIVFDSDQDLFRIRLKKMTTNQDAIATITQSALEALKTIGVPEPIKYKILNP